MLRSAAFVQPIQMPDQSLDIFNVIANVATVFGIVVALYVLLNVRRVSERLELVIAPKAGIEGFLNMCALVVESDPDGTCVASDNGEIVLVNKSFEDISGYHRSELIGQPIEMLVPANVTETHRHHREGFITRPSARPMRGLKLRHKRGWEIEVGINLNRFTDRTGGYTIAKVRVPDGEWAK